MNIVFVKIFLFANIYLRSECNEKNIYGFIIRWVDVSCGM